MCGDGVSHVVGCLCVRDVVCNSIVLLELDSFININNYPVQQK